jgi:hypothetical protein
MLLQSDPLKMLLQTPPLPYSQQPICECFLLRKIYLAYKYEITYFSYSSKPSWKLAPARIYDTIASRSGAIRHGGWSEDMTYFRFRYPTVYRCALRPVYRLSQFLWSTYIQVFDSVNNLSKRFLSCSSKIVFALRLPSQKLQSKNWPLVHISDLRWAIHAQVASAFIGFLLVFV